MVSQFDVYQLDSTLLVVLQSELAETATVVSAPLIPARRIEKPINTLMPELIIEGERYFLDTPNLAAIPTSILRRRLSNLSEHRLDILSAIDFLFTGF